MYYRICINEKLLIKPITITPTFTYNIIDKQTETTIKTGVVAISYLELTLDNATFGDYKGKTLLLQLVKGVIKEESLFVISGLYNKNSDLNILIGLLGENRKDERINYQDGYLNEGDIKIYEDSNLTELLDEFNLVKSYVEDFTPDYRYHVNKEKSMESD